MNFKENPQNQCCSNFQRNREKQNKIYEKVLIYYDIQIVKFSKIQKKK